VRGYSNFSFFIGAVMIYQRTAGIGDAVRQYALAGAVTLMLASAGAQAQTIKSYFETKKPAMNIIPGDLSTDTNGASAPVSYSTGVYVRGFEGISQYDGAAFGRNFIPPDTNGAVGKTQFMETTNGAYAVFDKTTGARLSTVSDVAFWQAAGQTGANGDSRVMYNAAAQRWIAISFASNAANIQIAISDTSNALGTWKSTQFTGFAGFGFGGTADYPTLAMDKNAVYIGTNNFAPLTSGGANNFRGTTLNAIPLDSLFGAATPVVTGMKQFVTPFTSAGPNVDRGFALQGVNSSQASSSGTVLAASLFNFTNLAYKVNDLTSSSATGASLGAVQVINPSVAYATPSAAHQPSAAIAANRAVIDSLDDRISSSVFQVNGRIYGVQTVNPSGDGGNNESRVRYFVLDANTFALLSEGDIGAAGFDYYQGSLAVNEFGEVVISYNRSGLAKGDLNGDGYDDGNISLMGRTFKTLANGTLMSTSDEFLLKVSLTDDYHNGSIFGQAAVGRQRWGDYSQVTVDPDDPHNFYVIGEFAREYNLEQFGHPGGTGGSRWGTWISVINTGSLSPVPEPSEWAMLLFGLGFVGFVARRRRNAIEAQSA
jgi:PEP-CTERM motif